MSRVRSRTSTISVDAVLKVDTSTISPRTRKRMRCCIARAAKRPPFRSRASVTTYSSPITPSTSATISGASSGSSTAISTRSVEPSEPESARSLWRSRATQLRSNSAKPVEKVPLTRIVA